MPECLIRHAEYPAQATRMEMDIPGAIHEQAAGIYARGRSPGGRPLQGAGSLALNRQVNRVQGAGESKRGRQKTHGAYLV